MESHADLFYVLEDILLILALAGVVIPALRFLKISRVLGYLLCGLVIGPYALGTVSDSADWLSLFVITDEAMIAILAELGVVFLLFMIGLELTFDRLWQLKRMVLGLGGLQVSITGAVIFVIALSFGNSLTASILLGAALALSSTAIVMQVLTDRHMIAKPSGQISFAVLLMQDLAVVPILVLAGAFSNEHSSAHPALLLVNVTGMAIIVIGGLFFFGKVVLKPGLHKLSLARNKEWLMAFTLFSVIGAAALTQSVGLSAALGAFLAGLLIGETEYRHEIEILMEPVRGILMGIFFLSIGMAINVAEVLANPVWLGLSVVGIFLLKVVLFYPMARLFKIPHAQSLRSGILLAQCGEFAFIVIGLAMAGNLIPDSDAQFFLLVIALSMLLTPLSTRLIDLVNPATKTIDDLEAEDEKDIRDHIVIAGFGRVGQNLAQTLEEQKIPYLALDLNGEAVADLRKNGYPVIYGNARHKALWHKLHVEYAKAVILTLDDDAATKAIVARLEHDFPSLPVIARFHSQADLSLKHEGTISVIVDKIEATQKMVSTLLTRLNMPIEHNAAIKKPSP